MLKNKSYNRKQSVMQNYVFLNSGLSCLQEYLVLKAGVSSLFLPSFRKNPQIACYYILIQVVWKN